MNKRISPHFTYAEFFPKEVLDKYGEGAKKFLDPKVILFMEELRVFFGEPIYINNWSWGGTQHNRGFRSRTSKVGGVYSQHRFGRACDFNVKNVSPDEVREAILAHQDTFMSMGLTRLEHGDYAKTWIHADCAWTDLDYIKVFKP